MSTYEQRTRRMRRNERIGNGVETIGTVLTFIYTIVTTGAFIYYGIKGLNHPTPYNTQATVFFGVACILTAIGHQGRKS